MTILIDLSYMQKVIPSGVMKKLAYRQCLTFRFASAPPVDIADLYRLLSIVKTADDQHVQRQIQSSVRDFVDDESTSAKMPIISARSVARS